MCMYHIPGDVFKFFFSLSNPKLMSIKTTVLFSGKPQEATYDLDIAVFPTVEATDWNPKTKLLNVCYQGRATHSSNLFLCLALS